MLAFCYTFAIFESRPMIFLLLMIGQMAAVFSYNIYDPTSLCVTQSIICTSFTHYTLINDFWI